MSFILVIKQLHAQNFHYNNFISCLYMFRAHVLIIIIIIIIIRRSKLYYTASGTITPIGVMVPGDLLMMITCARNM